MSTTDEGPARVLLAVSDRQGYTPDQVTETMTLGDLMRALEGAIEEFGEDAQIVTDSGDRYGACYGGIDPHRDLITEVTEDDDNTDEWGM